MTERTSILDCSNEMHMRVVYAGDDQPTLQVNDLRVRSDAFFDIGVGANPHEATLLDGHGLDPWLFRIYRVESPVPECEITRAC